MLLEERVDRDRLDAGVKRLEDARRATFCATILYRLRATQLLTVRATQANNPSRSRETARMTCAMSAPRANAMPEIRIDTLADRQLALSAWPASPSPAAR